MVTVTPIIELRWTGAMQPVLRAAEECKSGVWTALVDAAADENGFDAVLCGGTGATCPVIDRNVVRGEAARSLCAAPLNGQLPPD